MGCTGLAFTTQAQLFYVLDQSVPVEIDGTTLTMPWAGALNSPQFNTMDLNGDHQDDLVLFDRTANKIITFLNVANTYRYAPEYEVLFPAAVDQWLLLRDFNCDGKKDIFTSDPFGMRAFVNITEPGGNLKWRNFNADSPILTIGFNGSINLQVNSADIPVIDDIDGDGDLDILDARFVGIGSMEWHKNMSIENNGNCDSLQFKRITQTWGNFEECNCGQYIFGTDSTCSSFGGRIKHAAGKSSVTIDLDNDGDRDLLFSEETCSRLYLMPNTGTRDSAVIESFTEFPASDPLHIQVFPAPYYEDVDFDGVPDLIVTSNIYTRNAFNINFRESVWFYKNTGTSQLPVFTFKKNNFLQDQMIDVGDNAVPAFTDEDGDGDQDMFIATNIGVNNVPSSLYYFQNTGTVTHPSFRFVTNDYAGISSLGLYNLRPQFADVNGDGKWDLAFTATDLQTNVTSLRFFPNQSSSKLDLAGQPVITSFVINQPENLLLVDINQDGLNDLLVGRSTGSLQYWINNGPRGSFNYALQNESFLGLGTSTDRQSLAIAAADLDADGNSDLLLGDQRGKLSFFSDFRAEGAAATGPEDLLFYNSLTDNSNTTKLGGRIWPVITNLFNTNRPAIVVGNTLGGIHILTNDGTKELPPEPVIDIYPNPIPKGDGFFLKTDRNVRVQFLSVLGQKFSDEFLVPANESFPMSTQGLTSGIYIARFSVKGRTYIRKFIVY